MAYYCYEGSRDQVNGEMYNRNLSSAPVQMNFSPRPTQTRFVRMPLVHCKQESPVHIANLPDYEVSETYLPAAEAPYSGYANNVDTETVLRGAVFPLQRGARSKFIPSSQSNMYQHEVVNGRPVRQTHASLFREETFAPVKRDECGTGYKVFNNHTKYQVKGL